MPVRWTIFGVNTAVHGVSDRCVSLTIYAHAVPSRNCVPCIINATYVFKHVMKQYQLEFQDALISTETWIWISLMYIVIH